MEKMVVRKEDCGREIKKSESKKGGMGVNSDSEKSKGEGRICKRRSISPSLVWWSRLCIVGVTANVC